MAPVFSVQGRGPGLVHQIESTIASVSFYSIMNPETNAAITMHAARTALNRDPDLRQWAEQWLKDKERFVESAMSDEEFEKHWRYVRPERMHEGAVEAVTEYRSRLKDH